MEGEQKICIRRTPPVGGVRDWSLDHKGDSRPTMGRFPTQGSLMGGRSVRTTGVDEHSTAPLSYPDRVPPTTGLSDLPRRPTDQGSEPILREQTTQGPTRAGKKNQSMWTLLLFALLGLALAGLGTIYVKRRRLDRKNKAVIDDLLAASSPPAHPVPRPGDWDDLPTPIQRYLTHVLQDEQPSIQTVRLRQTGTFRSDGETSDWKNFSAIQHVTTHPPGFVWDASIEMMPGLSVWVLDAFADGQGILRARLGGVLPVANPPPGPALDEGELLRYLAESPLYPTALLPRAGVSWTAINDQSARATIEHRGTTASLVFHVNDRNEVERVTGKRPFARDDGTYEERGWNGTWTNYERRNGLLVPVDGEVAWSTPTGEMTYWRGHMDTIEHQFAGTGGATRSPNAPHASI